jgi:DNA repair photolyase
VLARELATKRTLPERVAFGTSTDPYQRAEGRYRLMPPVIDALARAGVPFSILTKGTVIRRDLDRLAAAAAQVGVELGLPIAYLDEELRRSLEPDAASTSARLDTLRAMRDAGFAPTVFVAPILPRLTDSEEHLDALIGALAEAGAGAVLATPLHLPRGVKDLFFTWLRGEHPDLLNVYTGLYAAGSQAPRSYRDLVRVRIHRALRGTACRRPAAPPPTGSPCWADVGRRRPPPSRPCSRPGRDGNAGRGAGRGPRPAHRVRRRGSPRPGRASRRPGRRAASPSAC